MRILDLRLKGVYYDLISAGKKKKEYRKVDDYYIGRLIGGVNMQELTDGQKEELIKTLKSPEDREDYMKKEHLYYRVGDNPGAYTHVRFRRGAVNTFMTVEIEDMKIEGGQFVIDLGKIVSKQ